MKAISLWQPWASLIALGAKRYETRGWPTSYRGPLLIHAAKTDKGIWQLASSWFWDNKDREHFVKHFDLMAMKDLPRGAILGVAEVADCRYIGKCGLHQNVTRGIDPLPDYPERAFGDYTPGRYAWRLDNVRRFATPIPYKGRQQLFDVPDEMVREAMAGAVTV